MKIRYWISLCWAAALLLTGLSVQAEDKAPVEKAQQINVGVFVLNVGKFDLSTGSYTMDFYLSLTSDQPIPPGSFEFMNGRATSLDLLINDPTNKFYRVQANLYENINLRAYPFDAHPITIQLEDKTNGVNRVVYKHDPANSGIDRDVSVVGWDLVGWSGKVEQHEYPVYSETYSKYIFQVNIHRIVLTSILKAFLPAVFLVLVGLLALLLKPDKFAPRLGLNTSSLLGAVMFHLNVTSQIPPVGYLTFADKFMLVSYIVLVSCLVSTIILMRHTDKKDETAALRIYHKSLLWIPIASIVLYALAFLTRG